MKVVVTHSVVAVTETEEVWKLHKLLGYACEQRHAVLLDPPDALAQWLALLDPHSRNAYENALAFAARAAATLPGNAATVKIERTEHPRWDDPVAVLPLDDALALLAEPVAIAVENSQNDWCFLRGIMRSSERSLVDRAVKLGWAQVLHGGGSTLTPQLEARLREPHKGLRTFALYDSDRRHPDELDPTWAPRPRVESCPGFETERVSRLRMPLRYWMLRRRFIESYMPRSELLEAVSPNVHKDAIEAFFRLSREGRWYFNMKKGFKGDEPEENRHRCRDLYAAVDAHDRAALREGFGPKLADHYAQAEHRAFAWDSDARQEALEYVPLLMRLL